MSLLSRFSVVFKRFSGSKRNSIGRFISLNKETSVKEATASSRQVQNSHPNAKQPPRQVFPIVAACTAESYDFSGLLPFLQKNFQLSPFICDEVLHAPIPTKKGEIFFFKNGSLVFWSSDSEIGEEGLLEGLKESFLPAIKKFEVSPFKEPDFEGLSYKFASNQR